MSRISEIILKEFDKSVPSTAYTDSLDNYYKAFNRLSLTLSRKEKNLLAQLEELESESDRINMLDLIDFTINFLTKPF